MSYSQFDDKPLGSKNPITSSINSPQPTNPSFSELKDNAYNSSKNTSNSVNCNIKSSYYVGKEKWTPVLSGTTTAGSFTYNRQIGWVSREGLVVDVWADMIWTSSGTAAGRLAIDLPYKVAKSGVWPFMGAVQTSTFGYGAGNTCLSILVEPDTFKGYFWGYGPSVVSTQLAVPAAGQIIFHIRYLGVQSE